jgi:hypothetical protein
MGEKLYHQYRGPKDIFMAHGSVHGMAYVEHKEEFMKRALDFIAPYLSK